MTNDPQPSHLINAQTHLYRKEQKCKDRKVTI